MSKKRLLERKKKKREEKNKENILKRRNFLRNQHKENIEETEKLTPYINPEKERLRKLAKIEENMQLMKKLQEEHDREVANRKALNKDLESKGCLTLQEKMDALAKNAEIFEKEGMELTN
jgi:hypothetical protein